MSLNSTAIPLELRIPAALPPPDEKSFCDADVWARFDGAGSWFYGHPTMMQLAKNVRENTEAVRFLTRALEYVLKSREAL